jgi:hypothetical protein
MSVKSLRGILLSVLAVIMLMVLASSVWAASALIDPDNAAGGKKGGDYELERDLEGGIHLVCNGIFMNSDKNILVNLTITTEDDMVIEISTDGAQIFDANNKMFVPAYSDWTWVGDTINRREVIGGIPIRGFVAYDTPKDYALTEFYPRVSFTFKGKKLVFRNVPAMK